FVTPGLHGVSAVAELKRYKGGRKLLLTKGLHGVSAVAELKPLPADGTGETGFMSPRRQCRGRIEASVDKGAIRRRSGLHGVSAVAELKRLLQKSDLRE